MANAALFAHARKWVLDLLTRLESAEADKAALQAAVRKANEIIRDEYGRVENWLADPVVAEALSKEVEP